MSVFHVEKRLTFTVLSVILLAATSVMNNGTNIQRGDTTGLRYVYTIDSKACTTASWNININNIELGREIKTCKSKGGWSQICM